MSPEGFKAFRKAMGWSQVQAANALGLSTTAIENYEKGVRRGDGKPAPIPRTTALACVALYHRLEELDFESIR